MNYLDELLALYPGQKPLTARYLLANTSGLPLGLDSDPLIEFLWNETAAESVTVGRQARRELGIVLPSRLKQQYGLEAGTLGVWSTYQLDGPERLVTETLVPDTGLLAAGWHAIAPLLARALPHLGGPSLKLRLAASLVAGRLHTKSGLEALIHRAQAKHAGAPGPGSFEAAAALAEIGEEEAHRALIELARSRGAQDPDLIALLSEVPVDRTAGVLAEFEARDDEPMLCAMAQALANDEGFEARELLSRLVARRRPWVSIYALDALAGCARPEDLALVLDVYRNQKHEFLRVQTARAAGEIAGDRAREFLVYCMGKPEPRIQAAALEGLARQRVDPNELSTLVAPLLDGGALKARVNAILFVGRKDPARVQKPLEALFASDQALHRVEAAFALGYFRGPQAATALVDLASADPTLAVRMQAIKSLAKQDPALAVPRLAKLLEDPDAKIATLAARALAALAPAAAAACVGALETAAVKAATTAQQGVLLRALGMAVSTTKPGKVPGVLAEALGDRQTTVLLGALEGVKALGDPVLAPQVEKLLVSDDARVRSRATVAAFLMGRLDASAALNEMLTSTDERRAVSGLTALMEIAVLLPPALAAARFKALRDALGAQAKADACAQFVEQEAPRQPEPVRTERRRTRLRVAALAGPFEAAPARHDVEKAPAPAPVRTSAPALARREVEDSGYLGALSRLARDSSFAAYKPLMGIAVSLAIPLVVVITQMGSKMEDKGTGGGGGVVKVSAGQLKITDVKGIAQRVPRGQGAVAAKAREVLDPGDKVRTLGGTGTRLALSDGAGNLVWLGESSGIALGVPKSDATTPTTPYVLVEPEGDVFVDFRRGKAIEVVMGAARLYTPKGCFRVTQSALGAFSVAVSSGDAQLTVPGAPARKLSPGELVPVKTSP
jgi:HEAT repeat protein